LGSNCAQLAGHVAQAASVPAPELASICNRAPQTPETASADAARPDRHEPEARQIPRSAPCPCKSGEKFKRCCGKNAPPALNMAA
jgi:uncharacterized protein YecA (UPF0149 family)